jgi:hypothetical protein
MTLPVCKLSVTIIARNEEAQIGDCLESVRWADMLRRRMPLSVWPLAIGSSALMPMNA